MRKRLEIEIPEGMQSFLDDQIGPGGMYTSADEYIRDFIRRDFERGDHPVGWETLRTQLREGFEIPEEEFVPYDARTLIAEAEAQE